MMVNRALSVDHTRIYRWGAALFPGDEIWGLLSQTSVRTGMLQDFSIIWFNADRDSPIDVTRTAA
jgi:hypothetical protein